MTCQVRVVEQLKTISERRLQPRVTLGNVHRVAVIGDVEQVAHRWLRRCSAVVQSELGHIVRVVAEVKCRGEVEDTARCVSMHVQIVLYEVRLLRLEHHTCVQTVLVAYQSEHHVELMDVVLIF